MQTNPITPAELAAIKAKTAQSLGIGQRLEKSLSQAGGAGE